jgi:hypothetical protein
MSVVVIAPSSRVHDVCRVETVGQRRRIRVTPSPIGSITANTSSRRRDGVVELPERHGRLRPVVVAHHGAAPQHVVDHDHAPLRQAGEELVDVAGVPGLVGVDERQVDRQVVGQLGEPFGGRAHQHLDPVVDTRLLPRRSRRRQIAVGDVEADETPAGRQRPGHPQRRHAGERADLHHQPGAGDRDQHRQEMALVRADVHVGQVTEPLPGDVGQPLAHRVVRRVGVPLHVPEHRLVHLDPAHDPCVAPIGAASPATT